MRNLFLVATIAALAHGAPHRDSHRELEPQTVGVFVVWSRGHHRSVVSRALAALAAAPIGRPIGIAAGKQVPPWFRGLVLWLKGLQNQQATYSKVCRPSGRVGE